MVSRLERLNVLVDLRLLVDEEDRWDLIYIHAWRNVGPTAEEDRYVQDEVARRRGGGKRDQTRRSAPGVVERDLIDAFRQTPIGRLWTILNRAGVDWHDDAHDPTKAYALACLSELAYLHLTDYELEARDRYKLFPSIAYEEMRRARIRFDLTRVVAAAADIEIKIIETRFYVYLVARIRDFMVVAVRGTASKMDIFLDLNALKNPARTGFYHRGFHGEACEARPLLENAVGTVKSLYFTGHSMGGAVASILSQIWRSGPMPMTPYVYASPRFGTAEASSIAPRYAYIKPMDFVPHLPPTRFGFSDAGLTPRYLPGNEQPTSGFQSLRHNLWRRAFKASHSMESYRKLSGEEIGESFPERVYIDAVMDRIK
jgi:hypothetical protein